MGLRVLVADEIAPEGLEYLQAAPGIEVDLHADWGPGELLEKIGDYHALVVRSRTHVTAEVLAKGHQLVVVGRAGVGVDNIDVTEATRRGVLVVNAPEANTISAAEHTLAMMMALARNIPQAHASLQRGEWARKRFMGVQLAGKTLGMLGLGRVGSEVARRAIGLEMRVLASDPYVTAEKARRLGVEMASAEEVCSQADFITIHTPLTPATRGMVSHGLLSLMRPEVRIINCARGGIIDEAALLEALQAGRVAGAALDVFLDEPPEDTRLLKLPQVIATPHLGASTVEAQIGVAVDVAEAIIRTLAGKPVRTAVNAPYIQGLLEDGKGYLHLAERLGGFFTDLYGGGFERLELTFAGEAAQIDPQALSTVLLKGILAPIKTGVNYVNARVLAEDSGFEVHETREPKAEGYTNVITVRGIGPRGEHAISGNLSNDQHQRIVAIDGYRLNVDTPGSMIVARNIDRPGVIGQVGTILGEYGINISFMQVGRKQRGQPAVMVLGVDDAVSEAARTQLLQLEALQDVRVVTW